MNITSIETDRVETYKKNENAWFYTSKDPLYELSNMAIGFPLVHKDVEWSSSEHLYQATKYSATVFCPSNLSSDTSSTSYVRNRIFEARTPMAAKITQKSAVECGLVRKDWQEQNVENMMYIVTLKLFCNYDRLHPILMSTAGKHIIEVSKRDAFWGCIKRFTREGPRLVGRNVLGKMWIYLRSVDTGRDSIETLLVEPEKFFI